MMNQGGHADGPLSGKQIRVNYGIYKCIVHYFIVFLMIFTHSTTCQHLSPQFIYTVRVFCIAIH